MSVSGICTLCTREVVGVCDRCGAPVCPDHYDRREGLCTECLRDLGKEPTRVVDGDDEPPDGVDTYRY